jgi:pyridoxamine 5'-phosphate oxidase
MVLLKTVDEAAGAFGWFTNLGSRKAREAVGSGLAALCWYWPGASSRQVRAVGRVEELDSIEAARYFATRPIEAQVGAIVSAQSRPVASRAELDRRAAALTDVDAVAGGAGDGSASDATVGALVMPADWGGLRLVADELEFWQGRQGRLHDRISFLRLDAAGIPLSRAAITAAGDTPEAGLAALRSAGTVVTDPHGTSWLRVRLEP